MIIMNIKCMVFGYKHEKFLSVYTGMGYKISPGRLPSLNLPKRSVETRRPTPRKPPVRIPIIL